jgi:hypothetical protein
MAVYTYFIAVTTFYIPYIYIYKIIVVVKFISSGKYFTIIHVVLEC